MIVNVFKDKIFPFYDPNDYPLEKEDILEVTSDDELIDNRLYEQISNVDNKLDHELIKKYFKKESLLKLFKYLKPSYNKVINSAKETLVESNLLNLKNDIKNMSDDEVKSKNLDLMANFVKKILNTIKNKNNKDKD